MIDPELIAALGGALMLLIISGSLYLSRRVGNADVLKRGLDAEAEILACRIENYSDMDGRRFVTFITFRFTPKGRPAPLEIQKTLDEEIALAPGARVPVKYLAKHPTVCLLVPYAKHHDAM